MRTKNKLEPEVELHNTTATMDLIRANLARRGVLCCKYHPSAASSTHRLAEGEVHPLGDHVISGEG